jgi:flagellar hook-associated protein 3 FlgL
MVADAGNRVLSGSAALVDLQAGLGHVQERIETSLTRLDSEAAALDMAIAELTVADPFATAAKLEATQVQLETLYAVTARLSSMGLAGYLR